MCGLKYIKLFLSFSTCYNKSIFVLFPQKKAEEAHKILEGLGPKVELVCALMINNIFAQTRALKKNQWLWCCRLDITACFIANN